MTEAVEHPRLIFRLARHELETIRGIGPKTAREIASFNNWAEVDRVLKQTRKLGADLMTFWDQDYPALLREIYDPPVLLWIKGNREALSTDSLAVVGTRKAGKYGNKAASHFTHKLVRAGLTVVSGLAYGIDAVAHRSAIEAGGLTVAVLGSGIDRIYPFKHSKLAAEIVNSGGAVISEFAPGTKPDAGNFPMRNRIVSGLSLGTLVVASGISGGSMITAKSALDQNREVFVIPHSLGQPNSEGCNALIQQGMGKLVQKVEDILEELPVTLSSPAHQTLAGKPFWRSQKLDSFSSRICSSLEKQALHVDDLAESLKVEVHELLPKLMELELQQCVRQNAGKNYELL